MKVVAICTYSGLIDVFQLAPANGLMAFTFHPNYTDTGKVYLYYIADNQGQMEQLVTEVVSCPYTLHAKSFDTCLF